MTRLDGNRDKWALLIGINKYPWLARKYQLDGCVNDVKLMYRTLRDNFGFPEDHNHMTVLSNGKAHRDAILASMEELAGRIGDDDIVVIFYAGHGSRMSDREGDEADDWDETIVPYDSGRKPYPNRDISDDEIYVQLLRLTEKTPYVTLIFDCCRSGTISRDPFGAKARWVEADGRPVRELPPSSVPPELAREASRNVGPSGWLPLGRRYVLLAGCRDDERAFEHRIRVSGGVIPFGALTYFLCQELVKAEPGTTYRDVFERASMQVTTVQPRQHPQMEGAQDRELFGVRDIEPMRFVRVRRRAGDRVILAAGAAHGMAPRSQWAVYPQGSKRVSGETPRLGLVEVTAVRAVTSDARIVEENGVKVITTHTRAVEEAHFYGEMRLVVDIQAPTGYEAAVTELAEMIEASALLRQAEAGEAADVRAYIIAPRSQVREGGPVPQLGATREATWAVVGQDGRLVMPAHTVDEENVDAILGENLEKVARYRQALVLRNPNEDSLLKGKVTFILKRQAADGTWAVAEPEDESGQIVFEEGERIAAEIVNHHDAPIYVSVLDFGLTGGVGLLHPSEQSEPGIPIKIGVREGDPVTLTMPPGFPYVPDPSDETPPGGTETFKLFATTHKADLSPLLQEGLRDPGRLRSVEGAGTPLYHLLGMALTGHGTRGPRRNRVRPDEEWTTVERSFFLRRKAL